MMRETGYAKLNLALHVRAREADGYHRIETIFAFCEDGDALSVEAPKEAGALELSVSGLFAKALSPWGRGLGEGVRQPRQIPGLEPPHPSPLPAGEREQNLVVRAARALRDHYQSSVGAYLHLDKRLPVAAGLGGGSADAAAALRLLVRWWGLPNEPRVLHAIARQLGADVPACLASRIVRGDGRGDELRPGACDFDGPRHVLLVNPGVAMPTGLVFAGWDGIDRGPLGQELLGRNDLLAPARRIAPVIGDVLESLGGATFAGLSGSGATCFGLFENEADCRETGAEIGRAHPGWWTLKTCLR